MNTFHDAGQAVINAAESGISFPLKKRDQLLDYILTLMRRHDEEGFSDLSVELLHTQVFNELYRYLFINYSEGRLLCVHLFIIVSCILGPCFKCLHYFGIC